MNRLPLCVLVTALIATSAFAEDFILTVNGHKVELDLDQTVTAKLDDGTPLQLTLRQKEILRFKSDLFSFEHKNVYKPNRNDLGSGIFQTMAVTPLGTGVLVQEYTSIDPTPLVEMMLHEVTKEEIDYGYKYVAEEITKQVGEFTLKGKQAVTSYGDEEWTRAVLAYGKKDRGVLVMTFVEKENAATEMELIDRFWKTFEIDEKLK